MGIFEVTTPEAILSAAHNVRVVLREKKRMNIYAQNVHYFPFNIPFLNILRFGELLNFFLPHL